MIQQLADRRWDKNSSSENEWRISSREKRGMNEDIHSLLYMKTKINQYLCILLFYNLDKSNIQSCAYLSLGRLHNVTKISAEILHEERNRERNEVLITDLVSFYRRFRTRYHCYHRGDVHGNKSRTDIYCSKSLLRIFMHECHEWNTSFCWSNTRILLQFYLR